MVFGVVAGSPEEPRVAWLERPVPVTDELLARTGSVPPTQVLLITEPCQEHVCYHYDGENCNLATRLVQLVPAVDTSLPACRIRIDCRWFNQEGRAVCMRCRRSSRSASIRPSSSAAPQRPKVCRSAEDRTRLMKSSAAAGHCGVTSAGLTVRRLQGSERRPARARCSLQAGNQDHATIRSHHVEVARDARLT